MGRNNNIAQFCKRQGCGQPLLPQPNGSDGPTLKHADGTKACVAGPKRGRWEDSGTESARFSVAWPEPDPG